MAKPRLCQHCLKNIPIDQGYTFDDSYNMICGFCNKIVFDTISEQPKVCSNEEEDANE